VLTPCGPIILGAAVGGQHRTVIDPSRGQARRGQHGADDLGTAGCSRTSGGWGQLGVSMPRRGVRTARVRSSRGGSQAKSWRSTREPEKAMDGGCEPLRHPSEPSVRARLEITCKLTTQSSSRAAAAQVRVPAGRVTTRRESETRTRRDENETRTRRSEKRETRREQVGGSSEYIASPKAPGVDLAYFQ
jgi:hypothetical protein